MKLLIIGIDGGDQNILSSFEMPFLKKLFSEMVAVDLEEDLWTRGWSEIISGQIGQETGAFYTKPDFDSGYGFTQRFSSLDYKKNPQIYPLWELLNERGLKIGFLNVPSTMPSPKVNGFLVSGAGGGFNPSEGIPPSACYPPSIHQKVSEYTDVWELRALASKIKRTDQFVDRAASVIQKRAELFSDLCDEYRVDIGFIVQKESVCLQNLAYSDIEKIISNPTQAKKSSLIEEKIKNFYKTLDSSLQQMVTKLQPEKIMIVSDHGSAPYLFNVNLNKFLEEAGYQQKKKFLDRHKDRLVQIVSQYLPYGFKKTIIAKLRLAKPKSSKASFGQHQAFTGRYIPGIYINDGRFSGIVKSEEEKNRLIEKIITQFNNNRETQKFGLTAERYKSDTSGSFYQPALPDIWVNRPDNMFFLNQKTDKFITKNKNYGQKIEIKKAQGDLHTGIKGRKPLCYLDKSLSSFLHTEDKKNLTLIYKIIDRLTQ